VSLDSTEGAPSQSRCWRQTAPTREKPHAKKGRQNKGRGKSKSPKESQTQSYRELAMGATRRERKYASGITSIDQGKP